MLDHVFLEVRDIARSVPVYEAALAALGTNERFDDDGRNGPPGHPDLKGFGANGRVYLWLREGMADSLWALWPIAGNRSTLIMPRRSRRELRTRALPKSDSAMTRATMLPTWRILTITASSLVYKRWQYSEQEREHYAG